MLQVQHAMYILGVIKLNSSHQADNKLTSGESVSFWVRVNLFKTCFHSPIKENLSQ